MAEWKCVPSVASYCCDILEGRDMAAVRYGVVVKRPFVRCMMTVRDINILRTGAARNSKDPIMVRDRVSEAEQEKNNKNWMESEEDREEQSKNGLELLNMNLLSGWPSFTEELTRSPRREAVSMYSLFKFEPFHTFHHVISNLWKEWTASYMSPDRLMTKGEESQRKDLVKIRG